MSPHGYARFRSETIRLFSEKIRVSAHLDYANAVGNVEGIVVLGEANVRLLLAVGPVGEENNNRQDIANITEGQPG